jgi:hypothetical protein
MTEQSKRLMEEIQLDRLVDGELSPQEYRALLAALEAEPGGWRRCALAFLEAQAWSAELRAVCRSDPPTVLVVRRPPTPLRGWLRRGSVVVAAAVLLLVAFGLGWFWNGTGPPRSLAVTGNEANGVPTAALARQDGVSPTGLEPQPAVEDTVGPWGDITLVADGATGTEHEIRVPLLPLDGAAAMRVLETEAPVPHDVQQALRHLGYEVRRDRRWTPVRANGHQVIVPLEQVEITPVANRAY